MPDYREQGKSLIISADVPTVNDWGARTSEDGVRVLTPPVGASGGTAPTTITAFIDLTTEGFVFRGTVGKSDPQPQTCSLTNFATGPLFFTITGAPVWCKVTPTEGMAPATIEVSVTTAGLAVGSYAGTLTVTCATASNSPQTLTVTLIMDPDTTPPEPPPDPDPISKPLWLGYDRVVVSGGNFVSILSAAANCGVLRVADFNSYGDASAAFPAALISFDEQNSKVFVGASQDDVELARSRWNVVAGLYVDFADPWSVLGGLAPEAAGDKLSQTETVIRDVRNYMVSKSLASRPFCVKVTETELNGLAWWPDGADYLILDTTVGYVAGEVVAATVTRVMSKVTAMVEKAAALKSTGPVLIWAQANDNGGVWTNLDSLVQLQSEYVSKAKTLGNVKGIIWHSLSAASGGGSKDLTAVFAEQKKYFSVLLHDPEVEVPSYPAYGKLTTCTSATIAGWAYDPDHSADSTIVELYSRERPRSGTSGRLARISTDGATKAFSIKTPASLLTAGKHYVYAYGLDSGGQPPIQLVDSPGSFTYTPPDPTPKGFSLDPTNKRLLLYGGSPFAWKGVTASHLIYKQLADPSGAFVKSLMSYYKGQGVTVMRMFGMLDWEDVKFGPGTVGSATRTAYMNAVEAILSYAPAYSMKLEYTIFCDTKTAQSAHWASQANRLEFVKALATATNDFPHFTFEVANEPIHSSQFFGTPQNPNDATVTTKNLIELGNAINDLSPDRVMSLGALHGTSWKGTRFAVAPADLVTFHCNRTLDATKWNWVTQHVDDDFSLLTQSTRALISDEPIRAQGNSPDTNPSRWWAFALLGQLAQFYTTFHFQNGHYCLRPNSTSDSQQTFDEWKRAQALNLHSIGGSFFKGFTSSLCPLARKGGELLVCGRTLGTTAGSFSHAIYIGIKDDDGSLQQPVAKAGWRIVTHDSSNLELPYNNYAPHYVKLVKE